VGASGGTAVWRLIAWFAIANAITSVTARNNAAPAATHNHRGDFGPPGGAGAGGSPGMPGGQ
jgi:hypothetical protein